nr:reverse transcriptase domain-containing protein [Tanacetum cinerariifolium]
MIFHIDSEMKHSYSNDDTCFNIDVINKILEEDFDSLLDEGSEILHSIEGTILEEKLFAEFDEFLEMTTDENSESESDTKEPPFEKITFNTDDKIKTSLEEPPMDLELKPLPVNLDFMKSQPLNFKGTEGVVRLIRWFEKMETVFHIIDCPEKYQVKYATCTLLNSALTWWNSHKRTIGTDAAFAMSWRELMKLMAEIFQEPTMLCTKMVPEEEDRVEKFIGGLSDNIQGNGYAMKNAKNKRKFDNNQKDNHGQNYHSKDRMLEETEDKSEEKRLEDVPTVRDFPEVFLEDLPGLPATQQVNFQIDLVPSVAHVA